MDDSTILKFENSNEEDSHKIVKEFISKHSHSFSFPQLATENKQQRLWQLLFKKLNAWTQPKFRIAYLEAIRILSRDKSGLNKILTTDMLKSLIQLAGLVSSEEAVNVSNKQNDFKVIVEAQKCLSNLIVNSKMAQSTCCNNGCIEGIVVRLKTYREPELPHDVKFFDMRMLFLLTALRADIRPKLVKELHGLTYLVEVLDLILKCSAEKHGSSTSLTRSGSIRRVNFSRSGRWDDSVPLLDDNDVDLACEVLKILFNLTIHVDKANLDEEEEAHFMRLVSILHDIIICPTQNREKKLELRSHTVNLLTNMPSDSYEELLTPVTESAACDEDNREYDGHDMKAVIVLIKFLEKNLDKPTKTLKESLTPILTCLCQCARSNRTIRKFLRAKVLPPLRDVYSRPEQGDTLRNKLCRLLTSPVTDVEYLAADFLFILCKENVSRLIKYTGYGHAAGLLASRGLMLGGGRGKGNYSSDSDDSDTEEYREVKDRINPVIGCYEEPRPDPMAGMSDEQKEYEALQLVNMMDKLARDGIVTPVRVGEDGKPKPMEHILEFCESANSPANQSHGADSDSE